MPRLIKHGVVTEDDWTVLPKDTSVEQVAAHSLVPLQFWLEHANSLRSRLPDIGVWIDSDEDVEQLPEQDLTQLTVIGVNFPAFMDGRGFSTARILRDRHGYAGELRAIGNFMRDQLYFLQRCGCDTFAPTTPWPEFEASVASLRDFSAPYQGASDVSEPLFRRVKRG